MRTRPEMPDDECSGRPPLLPAGTYEFTVAKAESKTSKKQNEMIALMLRVFTPDGVEAVVFDYLIDTEGMEWKTRHFARATGLSPVYDAGNLHPNDCMGVSGKVEISVDTNQQMNPQTNRPYPDKNQVDDYLEGAAAPAPVGAGAHAPVAEDDIPF